MSMSSSLRSHCAILPVSLSPSTAPLNSRICDGRNSGAKSRLSSRSYPPPCLRLRSGSGLMLMIRARLTSMNTPSSARFNAFLALRSAFSNDEPSEMSSMHMSVKSLTPEDVFFARKSASSHTVDGQHSSVRNTPAYHLPPNLPTTALCPSLSASEAMNSASSGPVAMPDSKSSL